MSYDVHPSKVLVSLFGDKPYQGADPEKAKVIVIGNDANYSPEISEHPFFSTILDYHADGVQFWKVNGYHHPFLSKSYPFNKTKGGVRYHKNFSKMEFESDDAGHFSFVELLNIPTIGNTGSNHDLFFKLLDKDHLKWLESIIFGGHRKLVLVNQTLARNITQISNKIGVLDMLNRKLRNKNAPSIVYESGSVVLYNGYSFSASITNDYLNKLGGEIRRFIREN